MHGLPALFCAWHGAISITTEPDPEVRTDGARATPRGSGQRAHSIAIELMKSPFGEGYGD